MRIGILLIVFCAIVSCGESNASTNRVTDGTVKEDSENKIIREVDKVSKEEKEPTKILEVDVEPVGVEQKIEAIEPDAKADRPSTIKSDTKESGHDIPAGTDITPVLEENTPPKEPIVEMPDTEKPVEGNINEPVVEEKPMVEVPPVDLSGSWDALLKTHVSASGKVDYKGFARAKNELNAYLDLLSANPPAADWGRKKKLAYWINAYNANTIKLIVDNYPVKSITDLHGGKPWDAKWIKIGGKTYSLNNIENDIIRPQFKDARIHFAVNCAAKSCPPLWNRAWTAGNLNSSLDAQAKKFINDSAFNTLGTSPVISKIFEWYAVDFGEIVAYLNKYATEKIPTGAAIKYSEYDWSLNE